MSEDELSMAVKVKVKGKVAVCYVRGEINIDSVSDLKKIFQKLIAKNERKVVLDCKELDYIDSAGLACLIQFSKDLARIQGVMFLAELSPKLSSLFAIMRLERAFKIYETLELALKEFSL